MRITTTITNSPKYDKVLRDKTLKAKQAVGKASNLLRNEIVKSFSTPKSGATYRRGGKVHTASAAGETPAVDTGVLRSNVIIKADPDQLGADVRSNADYSSHLEFGTSKMGARPFMHPAFVKMKAAMKKIFERLL